MQTAYVKEVSPGHQDVVNTRLLAVKNILLVLYTIIPIAAGIDKFLNVLTEWTKYLNPLVTDITGISAGLFMNIAGVIEVAASIFVFMNHRIGAYIVSAWLTAIALQLITGGMFLDVAVRDLAMAAGAFCLGLLSEEVKYK